MKEYTIRFNEWLNEDNSPRVIRFTNDGQFTRNNLTDRIVPQNEEMFEETIKAYLKNENCDLIND
jgi:hypothetical protein